MEQEHPLLTLGRASLKLAKVELYGTEMSLVGLHAAFKSFAKSFLSSGGALRPLRVPCACSYHADRAILRSLLLCASFEPVDSLLKLPYLFQTFQKASLQ